MSKRIGIVNSGGDCPGLNTVIDAVVQGLSPEYEVLGFYRGLEGLYNKDYMILDPEFTDERKFDGGTFLKSVNKGHFPGKVGMGRVNQIDGDVIAQTLQNYHDLDLECLVVLGGDGTMAATLQLKDNGINIVGVPKSIDNDLPGTDFTFGFYTALEITSAAMDKIITTARSHDRVMVLEVMGRHAGWISLYTGIAGGANCILIPEIPYDINKVAEYFAQRYTQGKTWGLVVIAEGAVEKEGQTSVFQSSSQSSEIRIGGAGDNLVKHLNDTRLFDVRGSVLGHVQRGGSPNSWDRILSRMFGAFAAKLVREGRYGTTVGYCDGDFTVKDLEVYAGKLKLVDPNGDMVQKAKDIGIYFGN